MLQEITPDQLKEGGRYFVREGSQTYFGTFLKVEGDHIKMRASTVGSTNMAHMYFHRLRYFHHTFYKCIPVLRHQWEQYWVNQILQDITGDETFHYSILQ